MSGSALFETFARAPLAFEKGEGSWLTTVDGERYLDFAAGIAVNSLGHGHPHLVAALTEQAAKLWHEPCSYSRASIAIAPADTPTLNDPQEL